MTRKNGNETVVTACTARVNSITKYLTAKDLLFVDGTQVKATDLTQVYQEALDTRSAAVTAKGEYRTAVASRNDAEDKRQKTDEFLRAYIVGRFGANSTEAHDFGFVPRKVTEKTAVAKAKATLLNKATRDARGTTSKKDKQRIKGTLTPEQQAALEVLVGSAATPATPPAVTSPAATPAASAPTAAPAVNGAASNGAAHS
ncbi:MAG TPA: hypothetical protein VGI39_24435 [Polyangiaceae bacterium]